MKCILPWINFGTSTYGRPRVCGYSDHDAQWEVLFTDRGYPYPPPPAEQTPEHILKSDFAQDWKSWLNKIGQNDSPAEELPDLGLSVVDFLAVVGAAETGVTTFPITNLESSVVPDLIELENIVVDLFPFPIAAVPGDRLTVRLMNGTGDFTVDSLARKHVISAGAEIVVVGNMETFDFQESKVVYRDPLIVEEVESLGAELGFKVEFDELISPVAEVTVVIGADFLVSVQ